MLQELTQRRRQLPYEDVWKMFGEGRHPNIKEIYDAKLAPFLTQASSNFWDSRLWYFEKGLYYQGGQVCFNSFFLPPFTLEGTVLKSAWLDPSSKQR